MIEKIKKIVINAIEKAQPQSKPIDFTIFTKTVFLVIIASICLCCTQYFGRTLSLEWFLETFKLKVKFNNFFALNYKLICLMWWVCNVILFYLIVPVIIIKLIFKQSLSYYGLSFKNAFTSFKLYFICFVIVFPLVILCSYNKSFANYYPFYTVQTKSDIGTNFFIWEFFYLFQFFAVEFFFRGFLLHGTKKSLGIYSILLATIPYCMIHFNKPMPEAIASIFAGIILGFLSLKNNNIWLGVAIHICIALLMDLCALWQKGVLF